MVGLLLAGCANKQDSRRPAKPEPAQPGYAEPGQGSVGPACVRSGCSGTVCVEEGNEVITTCEFRPEYACYEKAACERQRSGECGWTETPAFQACLAEVGTQE